MKKTRLLSILLTVCMIVSCMAGFGVTASAVDLPTVTADPTEGGTVSVIEDPDDSTAWLFTATPNDGYLFIRWTYTFIPDDSPHTEDNATFSVNKAFVYDEYDDITAHFQLESEVTTKKVTVVWDDNDNAAGKRPDSITIGSDEGSVTLNMDNEWTQETDDPHIWTLATSDIPEGYTVRKSVSDDTMIFTLTYSDNGGNNNDPEDEDDDDDDDDDDGDRNPWADKPDYKPSGASGTKAPDETKAPEETPADTQELADTQAPADTDEPEETVVPVTDPEPETTAPADVEITTGGNNGTVDANKDVNPHTGVALGGLAIAALAGAAMLVSKKRK